MKDEQDAENNSLIFGLSFITNCFFNVCFYGLLTPSVFYYITPAYCSFIIFDWIRFRQKDKFESQKKVIRLRKSVNDLKSGESTSGLENNTRAKKTLSKLNVKIDQHYVNEIPWTIFITFLYMLLLGSFPLSMLGYFGLAKKFSKYLSYQSPLLKSNLRPSLFFVVFDKMFYWIDKLCNMIFKHTIREIIQSLIHNIRDIFRSTLNTLANDKLLMGILILYFVVVIIVLYYFRVEKYVNRVQSKAWDRTKIIHKELAGQSFRISNPAYKIQKV